MADTPFQFIIVDSFFDDINRDNCFDTNMMDGVTPNYHIVLYSECPDNINDCLDMDGTLIDSDDMIRIISEGERDGECALLWSKGINLERTLSIVNSNITFDFGENGEDIKAMFLVDGGLSLETEGTGYVIAYAINSKSVNVPSQLVLPVDGMAVNITMGA